MADFDIKPASGTGNSLRLKNEAGNIVLSTNNATGASSWGTVAPAGSVIQVVSTAKTDKFSMSGSSFVAITGLTAVITPKTTSNKVLITCTIGRCSPDINTGRTVSFKLTRGGSDIGIGTDLSGSKYGSTFVASATSNLNYTTGGLSFQFLDSPATTSATTYGVSINGESDITVKINSSYTDGSGSETYDSVSISTITAMEIVA